MNTDVHPCHDNVVQNGRISQNTCKAKVMVVVVAVLCSMCLDGLAI